MATVPYQSTQTATATSGTTVAPSKPASLALGDLMIAHANLREGSGTTTTITPPATGWTTISTDHTSTSGMDSALFGKIADAGDVAASSFTFTASNTIQGFRCSISRFTNTNSSVYDQLAKSLVGGTTVSNTGITPTKEMGTFLIFTSGFYNGGTGNSVSGYSIANTNPTWTEAYDSVTSVAASFALSTSMAYASRPTVNATGNASATYLNNTADSVIYILNIAPPAVTTLSMASALIQPTSVRIVLANALSLASALIAPTASIVVNAWTNGTKHLSTWVNGTKH